ncbi:uncharacterized protein [Dermacentor albipictus]|uniref:uncharacterized protein isoform X2 n=1 Tax=Dermacentor albipictus TaxID=60249 RepID=UPI0031FBCC0A
MQDDMTTLRYRLDDFSYATLMKSLHADFPDPPTLAAELMELQTAHGQMALKLPLDCTATSQCICKLLDQLTELNDLLCLVGAEVVEGVYGKISLRLYDGAEAVRKFRIMELVAIYLHCILARHHCVDSLQFMLSTPGYHGVNLLLCHALSQNTSVTCLHLQRSTFDAKCTSQFFRAISHLLKNQLFELSLESLVLNGSVNACFQGFLTSLSTTKTLKEQALSFYFTADTISALARNWNLFSLVIDATFASPQWNEKLLRMFTSPLAPVQLTVISCNSDVSDALSVVLYNLRRNNTVRKVIFQGFSIGFMDMRFASDLLAANAVIQEICFTESTWDFEQSRERWHATALVRLLASAAHLRRLAVPFYFDFTELRSILEAAQGCKSLEELHFPVLLAHGVEVLFDALNFSPLVEKLRVGKIVVAADTEASRAVTLLQNAFSGPQRLKGPDLLFGPRGDSPWLVGGNCGGHLTNLMVMDCSERTRLHPDIARCLGAYLPLTRSLKTLTISVATFQDSGKFIIQGLALNESIEELFMKDFSAHEEDLPLLCAWISRSQRVHSVQVFFDPITKGLFLQTLAGCMEYNHTLTSLSMGCQPLESAHELLVKNITRRNFGLVQCAASYVLGCSTQRAEAAFKFVAWHPQLLPAVQKMGLIDDKEAQLRIREAGRPRGRSHVFHQDLLELRQIIQALIDFRCSIQ